MVAEKERIDGGCALFSNFQPDIMETMLPPTKVDSQIMHGALCFTGTRVTVETLFDWLEEGHSIDFFLEQFPSVKREQVIAVLESSRRQALEQAALNS